MKEANENIVIKYLAKEELTSDELELIHYLQESNADEFEELRVVYNSDLFHNKQFDKNKAFIEILNRIENNKTENSKNPIYLNIWFKVAASLLLLISLGILGGTQYSWNIELKNQTTKLANVILPDGSTVILDKNTSILYSRTFFKKFDRELTLAGRAHFEIAKNKKHSFIIHNPMVDVEVLGTQFTINQNKEITQIILKEGIVKLSAEQFSQDIYMDKVGTQVILNEEGVLKDNIVSPPLYTSWTKDRLSFNQSTVKEIAQFIEDTYGIELHIDDSSHLEHTLYGSAPSDDPQLIISAINKILDSNIESSKKK